MELLKMELYLGFSLLLLGFLPWSCEGLDCQYCPESVGCNDFAPDTTESCGESSGMVCGYIATHKFVTLGERRCVSKAEMKCYEDAALTVSDRNSTEGMKCVKLARSSTLHCQNLTHLHDQVDSSKCPNVSTTEAATESSMTTTTTTEAQTANAAGGNSSSPQPQRNATLMTTEGPGSGWTNSSAMEVSDDNRMQFCYCDTDRCNKLKLTLSSGAKSTGVTEDFLLLAAVGLLWSCGISRPYFKEYCF